jgi:hypothetical protein
MKGDDDMKMRNENAHQNMLRAGKAWQRIKQTATRDWSDWTAVIGPALVLARNEAMDLAQKNEPKGSAYNGAMTGLLKEYELNDMDAVTRSDLFSVMKYLTAVEDWRRSPEVKKHATRMNNPTTVWRAFKASSAWKAVQMQEGTYKPKPPRQPRRADGKVDLAALEGRQSLQRVQSADVRKREAELADLDEQIVERQQRLDAMPQPSDDSTTAPGETMSPDDLVTVLVKHLALHNIAKDEYAQMLQLQKILQSRLKQYVEARKKAERK